MSILFKWKMIESAHVIVRVVTPEMGHTGTMTLRKEDWDELQALLAHSPNMSTQQEMAPDPRRFGD